MPLATRNLTMVFAGILIFCCVGEARACLPLLLDELAESRQDAFAVLFGVFVRDGAKRIEKYSSGSFIGLCGFGNLRFEVLSWSYNTTLLQRYDNMSRQSQLWLGHCATCSISIIQRNPIVAFSWIRTQASLTDSES